MQKDKQERDYVISGNFIRNLFPVNEMKFKFDSLEFKKNVSLGIYDPAKDPKFVIVYPGLNIQGLCENKNCWGGNHKAWVKKGYGSFSLGQIRTKNKCPDCGQNMAAKSFKGLGYTRAKVEFEGVKIVNDKEIDFNQNDEEKQGKFIKFEGADENLIEWEYLNINVTLNSQLNVSANRR